MLVSVIVPVYKAEKWLHRCVDSILTQTMEDFELLLIDDGSPDRSGEICDEYAAKDSRVRVFHKENGGVSSARNLGLDNAKGEYICFLDSDDWIDSETLEACEDVIMFGNEKFRKERFPEDEGFEIYDLIAKYGLRLVLDQYLDYKKEQ